MEQRFFFFFCLGLKNRCSLWFTMNKQDTDQHCAHREAAHTYNPQTTFDCSRPPPLLPSFASSFLHWHSVHLICVDPCLPRSHTAASPVKRRAAANEQALPLRGADRALIWRLMLRKKLIKGERWERGRGLSRRVKASQLSGLIGRGASGQLLGRDWVTWWLFFHTVTGCTFTHPLPRVCSQLMNSTLWSAEFS